MIFNITAQEAGERLDKFLTEKFTEYSRSFLQKIIKEGAVLVSGQKVRPHYFLKIGERVEVENLESKIKKLEVVANPKIKLDIIFEDENFLIINKPAGLVVHQAETHPKADTLVNGLLTHCPEVEKVGEDLLRPGIVHRLDKNVSGLMVVAKTPVAFDHLKREFKERRVRKIYTGLVQGELTEDGEIDFPIERSRSTRGKMAARAKNQAGRLALTKYEVLKNFQNYTLLQIQIKTGRMHQIRVHFNALNYPIMGDQVYRPKKLKLKTELERIFLQATELSFNDLEGELQEFKIELAPELKKILMSLKPYVKTK